VAEGSRDRAAVTTTTLSSLPFTVDITPADGPPRRGARNRRPKRPEKPAVTFRFTGHRRLVNIVNNLRTPIFNVEVRERHRAVQWLSKRRPRVLPGITPVRLGQSIAEPANVYVVFDDAEGKSWIVHSDGWLTDA